jgi:hypothetical protein
MEDEDVDTSRRRGTVAALALSLIALAAPSCRTVEFYEKQHVSSRLMAFESDTTDVHAQQKVWYSREGATGGIGSTGAGGCGCAN